MTRLLAGRSAIVTGGSLGIGLAIADAYVAAGANVLICARTAASVDAAVRRLAERANSDQIISGQVCDVTDADAVEACVARALNQFGSLQILVNAAGVYGPIGTIEQNDWAEWTRAIEINLMGSVLPCRFVLPHFRERGYGKIVQMSGGGAASPLPRFSAYAASKAAIVRFIETLAQEYGDAGIDANAIAPGAVNTRLLDEVLAAGPHRVGDAFYTRSLVQKEKGGTAPERGADLAVFLGSGDSDGITGRLIAALWDPWDELPQYREELAKSDIYTLRRIVPEDRDRTWSRQ